MSRPAFCIPLAVWIACTAAAPASAQAPASAPNFMPYFNKNVGFQMNVPAGFSYDRAGFFGPGGCSGVLRGAGPSNRDTLQLLVFEKSAGQSLADWVNWFSERLSKIEGTLRVAVQDEPGAARPCAFVNVDAASSAESIRSIYFCAQLDDLTVLVFATAGVTGKTDLLKPEESRATDAKFVVPDWIKACAGSLQVLSDARVSEEVRGALQRGKEYLARFRLQEDIRKLRIDENVRAYEVLVNGQAVGYLTRQFARERQSLNESKKGGGKGRDGVRVRERSWRFGENGASRVSDVNLFSSIDGDTDLLEFDDTDLPQKNAQAKVITTRDQCVRGGDVLFSSFSTSEDRAPRDQRSPIKLNDTYLGLAWARLLPALLGPSAADAIAFSIYDAETRTLESFTIKPLGEKPLPGEPDRTAAAYEIREGMIAQSGTMYTDTNGHMLRFEQGDLVVRLADLAAIDRRFGADRKTATDRLERKPATK